MRYRSAKSGTPGSELVGIRYTHLFHQTSVKYHMVMTAPFVTADSGTGLVHMAPGHGADDYKAFVAEGFLSKYGILCPVDSEGRFTAELGDIAVDSDVAQRLQGKEVLYGGTKEMIHILHEKHVLLAEHKLKHKYPYDWKTKKPIIVRYEYRTNFLSSYFTTLHHRATSQWFANVDDLRPDAQRAISRVDFHPEGCQSFVSATNAYRSLMKFPSASPDGLIHHGTIRMVHF